MDRLRIVEVQLRTEHDAVRAVCEWCRDAVEGWARREEQHRMRKDADGSER